MYGIREVDNQEERSSKEFPAYNIYPDKEWGFELKNNAEPQYFKGNPKNFDVRDDLPRIQINAYKILDLDIKELKTINLGHVNLFGEKRVEKLEGNFKFTPDLLKKEYKTSENFIKINLVPYGACKIRQTVFKKRKDYEN
jgi:hypothetical protein